MPRRIRKIASSSAPGYTSLTPTTGKKIVVKRTGSQLPRPILFLWFLFVALSCYLYLLASSHRNLDLSPGRNYLILGRSFEDLIVYLSTFRFLHTERFFHPDPFSKFAYPAGAAVVYRIFYALPHLKISYLLPCVAWAAYGVVACAKGLLRRGVPFLLAGSIALSGLLGFPFFFLVQRGNIEIALWVITSLGVLAYARNRPYVAAVLWGVAACIKIYPILLLGIFIGRRVRFGPILAGVGAALLSTLAAVWYVGPTVRLALSGFLGGVQGFQGHYAKTVRPTEIGFDHSLVSVVKLLAISTGHGPADWLHPYYIAVGVLATLVFFLRVRYLPFLNRFLFTTVAFVLLPPVSYEYTLVHLYLPAALLLFHSVLPPGAQHPSVPQPKLTAALLCMVVLFLPANLFVLHGRLYAGQVQVFPLLLLGLLSALASWPRETSSSGGPETAAISAEPA